MAKIIVPVFCFLLLSTNSSAQTAAENRESLIEFTENLEDRVLRLMERYEIPGASIALIKDFELVWSEAYGYSDLEQNRKMSVDDICRTESISKSVTAWGIMKLVEGGQLDLDVPVQQYLKDWKLPDSQFSEKKITVRRLLSNSAGLPLGILGEEYSPESNPPPLREYLANEVQVIHEPGSRFEYSNVGFNVLELLVEEVTRRDFAEYMKEEVLTSLGMVHSSYAWNEHWSSKVPMGYDLHGNAVPPYVYPAKASGGLFSTVEDIARFAIAEMAHGNKRQPKVLSEESIQTIQMPQIKTSGIFGFVADGYGFGHFTETLPDGKRAVWHGGQGHGWMTHFHSIPQAGDGIVIFTNSQRSWPFIAHVLGEWTSWNGNKEVKFSRITTAIIILKYVVGLIFLFSLWRVGRLIYEYRIDKRKLSFSLRRSSKSRVIEFFTGGTILALLIWAINQKYLFISSIFPLGSTLLGWSLLLLSTLLLVSVLFPQDENS